MAASYAVQLSIEVPGAGFFKEASFSCLNGHACRMRYSLKFRKKLPTTLTDASGTNIGF